MTLLWTLLTTFFVDDGPSVPAPATNGAITVDAVYPEDDSFNLPRLTPTTRYRSPSWMVASPSVKPIPFNELSPAAGPPQEFPGLFPCTPAALVPCPAPTAKEESPAVRHVSFLGGGAELTLAVNDASETQECPATGSCPKDPSVVQSEWKRIHRHGHGPHDPAGPMFIAPFFPPHPLIPFDVHQTAFADPADSIPQPHPAGPFAGAKKVRHVVSATYDVPHTSAANLQTILEQGEGVLSCEVNGDELTVTAYPPYQAAIAQFLQAMDLKGQKPQMISRPIQAIGSKSAASKCCSGECACKTCECKCQCCGKKDGGQAISRPVRAIDVKATKSKCCNGDCKCKSCECKCECCGKKDEVTAVDPGKFSLAKSLAYHYYSFVNPPTAIHCRSNAECSAAGICKPDTTEKPSCFSFHVGVDECKPCPTSKCECRTVEQCSVQDKKPVRIQISASADTVILWTSEGNTIRAKRIQLETDGIQQLKVEQSSPLSAKPEQETNRKVESKPLDTSAVCEPANAEGFFQLAGPYSALGEVAPSEKNFQFGGVEIRR